MMQAVSCSGLTVYFDRNSGIRSSGTTVHFRKNKQIAFSVDEYMKLKALTFKSASMDIFI